LLADRADHPLDLDRLDPAATLDAMIDSFNGDESALAAIIMGLLATQAGAD
jgi:cell filamentation protein